ncbi:MAG: Ig-like domain-containing protein [Spirochaetales bacterium]|nr:Ig-like domain-containing protein [Spirochaetales bacterium]
MKKGLLIAGISALLVFSCRSPESSIPVEGMRISPESITLQPLETAQLTAEVLPENAGNTDYGWISNDPEVVTVNLNGLVTAYKVGTTEVTAISAEGVFKAVCTVTVESASEPEPETIPITGISLNNSYQALEENTTFQLTAICVPENATNKDVEWVSNNPEAVSVDQFGLVTALQPLKTVIITVNTLDGTISDSCTISTFRSSNPIPATSLTLNSLSLSLLPGESELLTAVLSPSNTTNTAIIWLSLSPGIASVDENGRVTAVSPGEVMIYAKSTTIGVSANCQVTVLQDNPVQGISIQSSAVVMDGEFVTLPVYIDGFNAGYTQYNVSSSSISVAGCSVIYDGVRIIANSPGEVDFTVTTIDNGDSAVCRITVLPTPVTGVVLEESEKSVNIGAYFYLSASVEPSYASNPALSWTSSAPDVASVDSYGLVIPKAVGEAVIAAVSVDGGLTAACTVTVSSVPVTGIQLSQDSITLSHWETVPLGVTILPSNASYDTPVCSSDNEDSVRVSVNSLGEISIYGRLPGSAEITVTNIEGNYSAVCTVTVEPVAVTAVELSSEYLELIKGETASLTVAVSPFNASDKSYEWLSDNESIARGFASGSIFTYNGGTTFVTVRSISNPDVTASCTVTVTVPVSGVSIEDLSLPLGTPGSPTVTVFPVDATDKAVTYSIANPSIASVAEDGTVTAVMEGTTDLTVTTVDGEFTAVCTIESGRPDITPVSSYASNLAGGKSFGVPGDFIDITTTIFNGGTCRALETEVDLAYYLSDDPEVTTGDYFLANAVTTINIQTGGTQNITRTVTVPELTPGIYYIGCAVDTNNEISEMDETNNTAASGVAALFTLVDDTTPNSSGAFKILNSWGIGGWENVDDGHFWIDYESAKSLEMEITYYHNNFGESYEPSILAVFEVEHLNRGDCRLSFGLGDPSAPLMEKRFQDQSFSAGEVTANPFPDNKMALDISEFAPYINDHDLFLRINNLDSSTGELLSFNAEFYSDFDLPAFKILNSAVGSFPAESESIYTIPSKNSLTVEEEASLKTAVLSSFTALVLNEETPGVEELEEDKRAFGIYEEGRNYNIIVDGKYGTGLAPLTQEQWESMVKLRGTSTTLMRGLLPDEVDNSDTIWFPPVGSQGDEGSCASFSVGYYIQTYTEARERNWDLSSIGWTSVYPGQPDSSQDKIMSPEFIYHQINRGEDNGSSIVAAANFVTRIGGSTWADTPYVATINEDDVTSWPSEAAFRNSGLYRGSEAMNTGEYNYNSAGYFQLKTDEDIQLLKTLLASGYCVSVAVAAGGSGYANTYTAMDGNDVLAGYTGGPLDENHANTIVGYKEGASWDSANPEN